MKDRKKIFFTVLALLQLLPIALMAEESTGGNEEMNPLTGDTWLIAAWGKICTLAKNAWEWFRDHVQKMLIEDLGLGEADSGTVVVMLVVLFILTLMLASGAWAASIAQMRRHPAPKFFLFGFFTFFIGPAHLLYSLDIKGEEEQKAAFAAAAAQKRAEAATRAKLEEEQALARGKKQVAAVSTDGIVWNKDYFISIQRKEDGTHAGPWAVQFNNIPVTVLKIIEVFDENVQVQMLNLEGVKTMGRIPFARIQKWEAIDPAGYEAAMADEPESPEENDAPAQEEATTTDAPIWDEQYFASIRTNADGTPAGPWTVAYNGVEIKVVQIVEVLKECVQVKMINLEGMPMNGRIPYNRIEKWEPANE